VIYRKRENYPCRKGIRTQQNPEKESDLKKLAQMSNLPGARVRKVKSLRPASRGQVQISTTLDIEFPELHDRYSNQTSKR
jgi:hypothetical protein